MKVIVIDPGHGGRDPGAVGPGGTEEKEVNLAIAHLVKSRLERDFTVFMTRQNDETVTLNTRSAFSNAKRADLFISIHCNAATNPAATGMEIFTSRGQTRADSLATCIMAQMADEFPVLPVRGDWADGDVDKEAGLYVLMHTEAPAVLVEMAFITNPDEEKLLASTEGKRKFAAAIARGVTDWQAAVC